MSESPLHKSVSAVNQRFPDFLLVGAMKSGTTALWQFLSQHPEIYMSQIKEPAWFYFACGAPLYHGPKTSENPNYQ